MLIFLVHVLFLVTARAGFHALMLKKLICFLIQPNAAALFVQDICLCLRCSIVAPVPPLKAYSAPIGQFKHTFQMNL